MDLKVPVSGESLAINLKLPGETCNINCLYCYEKRKPYEGNLNLDPTVLANFLQLLPPVPLTVMLHGGEPLLVGIKRMRALLEILRTHPASVSVSVQTNGMLLNDTWIDFFEECWPGIYYGISLDGDETGNSFRLDYRGNSTHSRVTAAFERLAARDLHCGVIAVINRRAAERPEALLETLLRYEAIKNVKLTPCMDYSVLSKSHRGPTGEMIDNLNPTGDKWTGWSTTPHEYSEFVIAFARAWVRADGYKRFLVDPITAILRAVDGRIAGYTQFDKRKDPYVVTLYPDGRIGSSDELQMPDALLGRVDDGVQVLELLAKAQKSSPVFLKMQELLAACRPCSIVDVCRGGGLSDRLRFDTAEGHKQYCDSRSYMIAAVNDELVSR